MHKGVLTRFHVTLISSNILGLVPLALSLFVTSLSPYHFFLPLTIPSNGIITLPISSDLLSSCTVTSKTDVMSVTPLEIIKPEIIFTLAHV